LQRRYMLSYRRRKAVSAVGREDSGREEKAPQQESQDHVQGKKCGIYSGGRRSHAAVCAGERGI